MNGTPSHSVFSGKDTLPGFCHQVGRNIPIIHKHHLKGRSLRVFKRALSPTAKWAAEGRAVLSVPASSGNQLCTSPPAPG